MGLEAAFRVGLAVLDLGSVRPAFRRRRLSKCQKGRILGADLGVSDSARLRER
jgi:hypothetical protein